jgi:uncharacterized protein (TIGR01777 family)
MKVLVTGSTGLIGSALVYQLKRAGHEPIRLVRHRGNFDEPVIAWNPESGQLNPGDLKGIDAVVHLAGHSIASGRWTPEVKRKIRDSRVKGTQLLASTLAGMENPPSTLICASAIGFYGNRGEETLTEVSGQGQGFLPGICREWEAACQPARDRGIRVVNTRFGIVLSPEGGALKAMLPAFRFGLAGNLGSGRQYMSWIALEDAVGAIIHILTHPKVRGPVNMVAPNPVINADFTTAMRHVLMPPFLPMRYWTPPAPGLAVKLALGEMGEALLLSSTRVLPIALQESGYPFKYKTLEPALRSMV